MRKTSNFKKKRRYKSLQEQLHVTLPISKRQKNKKDSIRIQESAETKKTEEKVIVQSEKENTISTASKENILKNFNGNFSIKNSGTFHSNYRK